MRRYLARVDAVLVQAVIAGALSFSHLQELADAAGQTGWKAWAYPISVDLLLVAAWRRLRSGIAKGAGWCWFLIALAASLGANVATAGLLDLDHVPDWLRILVAGWPALAFLGGTLLVHTPTTVPAGPESEPARAVEQPEEPAPAAPLEREPAPEPERAPEIAPAPAVEPAPELPAAPPQAAVPPALLDHARKLADTHHATTGRRIDPDTLRARLGVPAPLADSIAAQLT